MSFQQHKQQQQIAHNIERPPYYHLPRSRPVTFEQPCYDRDTATSYDYQSVQLSGTQSATSQHATYNNSPRPFSQGYIKSGGIASTERRWDSNDYGSAVRYAQDDSSAPKPPRILVNDQSYPTSTVHKSMLQSKRPTQHATGGQASLERLVQPTVMTASYESLSPQTVNLNTSGSVSTSFSPTHTESDSQQVAYVAEAVIHAAQSKDQRDRRSASVRPARSDGNQWYQPYADHVNIETNSNEYQQAETGGNTLLALNRRRSRRGPIQSSNTVLPDTKRDEYMWNKQLEQVSIAHQTYRTLPIVSPKPKARHDLASGNYMRLNQDPTWDLYTCSRPSSASSLEHDRKIQQAVISTIASRPMPQNSSRQQEETSPAIAFNYREYIQGVQRPPTG